MTRISAEEVTISATDEKWQKEIATYYGMISRINHQFCLVINKTKALGLWGSTVIISITAHSEFPANYGLVENWPSGVSKNLAHGPLVVGGGELPQGMVYNGVAEMVTLIPALFQFGQVSEFDQHYGLFLVDAMLIL